MPFMVDKMLQDILEHGFSTEELKETIQYTLAPYFKNKEILNEYIFDSQILSMFGFFILYRNDNLFIDGIKEVLELYSLADKINRVLLFNILISTINEFSQKENLMWNVKLSTPNSVPNDIYDASVMYMKHIGDTLELSGKMGINELYAIIKIIQEENLDYKNICKLNFGVVIKNILDKNKLVEILKTFPIDIKLSDWRNIAYHHSYHIDQNKIICFYGKENKSFTISIEDLKEYTVQIIRSCNIVDIARRIFFFDNMELLAEKIPEQYKPSDRFPMKISQLNTSLITQGFTIIDYKKDDKLSEITIQDIRNNGSLLPDDIKMRKIHSTQFLYNLWEKIPSPIMRIIYCDNRKIPKLTVSVNENICKIISSGNKELPFLAANFEIEDGYI